MTECFYQKQMVDPHSEAKSVRYSFTQVQRLKRGKVYAHFCVWTDLA